MTNMIVQNHRTAKRTKPAPGVGVITRSDGSSYVIPSYDEYRCDVREQYKHNPDLERVALRLAFDMERDDIAYLRSHGANDLADMFATEWSGLRMPMAKWMREAIAKHEQGQKQEYRESHRKNCVPRTPNTARAIGRNCVRRTVNTAKAIARNCVRRARNGVTITAPSLTNCGCRVNSSASTARGRTMKVTMSSFRARKATCCIRNMGPIYGAHQPMIRRNRPYVSYDPHSREKTSASLT